jgi:hypothetical protein
MLKRLKKAFKFLCSLKLGCGCVGCKTSYEPIKPKCDGKCVNCKCGDEHNHKD